MNQFIIVLARQGMLPNALDEEFVLESDIQELMSPDPNPFEYAYSLYSQDDYAIIPAIFYGQGDVVLCKSWVHKKWKQTKKFIKKHKKEIIIGAAVVAAVVIVVCAVSVATAGAAAAGAAAASASDEKPKIKEEHEPAPAEAPSSEPSLNIPPSPPIENEMPILKSAIEEQISAFKEVVVEENLLQAPDTSTQDDFSFEDTVRMLGALLAHEVLDGVSDLVSYVPALLEEIQDIGHQITDVPISDLLEGSPMENYQELVDTGHEKIDQAFSTDLSGRYSLETKRRRNKFVTGILPIPLAGGACSKGRIAATQASDICGWKVGAPIENRTAFGTVPKWSSVRRRYWKNRADWAKSNPHEYTPQQMQRMEKGLAPQKVNERTGLVESKELHHNPSQKDGGLFDVVELWPEEHARADPHRFVGE